MSDPHHDHASPHAALPFHDADWQQFKKDDITAGGAIIKLMTAIFLVGVVLYSVVAFYVWR